MDRLSKLEALAGGGVVIEKNMSTEADNPWPYNPNAKANNVYEGTDSEDEEIAKMMSNTGTIDVETGQIIYKDGNCVDTTNVFGFDNLQQGELAPEGVRFMPFKMVTKYPYQFIGHANRQRVVETFFDKGKVYGHTYDLFYLYADQTGLNPQPVVLIPTKQFERLLEAINLKLKTRLTIPKGGAGDAFYFGFMNDGNPHPRYLGRSTSREHFDDLKFRAPPYYYKLDDESGVVETPSDRSLVAFQSKFAQITANEKGKKAAQKDKQTKGRIQRQQGWGASIKRVQYYLGIREVRDDAQAIQASLQNSGLDWVDVKAAAKAAAAKLPPPTFDPGKYMKFKPLDSVVFISVDVEAYEMNHKQITEIGVATLDTLDLVQVKPGNGGRDWMQQIRARHFRIHENRFLINRVHVSGCPDSFEFGESEFISMNDAPSAVASCFKHPFSGPDETLTGADTPKRNIVLVGHNVDADINFLKSIGYDVTNLSNLKETVDTADMWKYVKQETNPSKLGAVLHDLGLVGWNLHNAGNDAVYTLQVMIGTAIKHITDKSKGREVVIKERLESLVQTITEVAADAMSRSNGWDTDEEDGGVAVAQVRKSSDKGAKSSVLKVTDGFQLLHRPKSGTRQGFKPTSGKSLSSQSEDLIDFRELSISNAVDREEVKYRREPTEQIYEGEMNKPLGQFLDPNIQYPAKETEGTTGTAASAPARQMRYTEKEIADAIRNAPGDESALMAMTLNELMNMPHVTRGRARYLPFEE